MPRLFSAFKGNAPDPIRQSASLTMAALLEQNRKFEAFMRRKVEDLEARVVAQQARLSEGSLDADFTPPAAAAPEESFSGFPAETDDVVAAAVEAGPASVPPWQAAFGLEGAEPVPFAPNNPDYPADEIEEPPDFISRVEAGEDLPEDAPEEWS